MRPPLDEEPRPPNRITKAKTGALCRRITKTGRFSKCLGADDLDGLRRSGRCRLPDRRFRLRYRLYGASRRHRRHPAGFYHPGFFFSVGTLGTVGYGNLAPHSLQEHRVAAFEILLATPQVETWSYARSQVLVDHEFADVISELAGMPQRDLIRFDVVRPLSEA